MAAFTAVSQVSGVHTPQVSGVHSAMTPNGHDAPILSMSHTTTRVWRAARRVRGSSVLAGELSKRCGGRSLSTVCGVMAAFLKTAAAQDYVTRVRKAWKSRAKGVEFRRE